MPTLVELRFLWKISGYIQVVMEYSYYVIFLGVPWLFTLPYMAWPSIVIEHEKSSLFLFFRNISKTAETILIKKIGRNHGILVYEKALISEHRKNNIFRDNNCFVKMSVSLLARTLQIFVEALVQKLV